MDGKCEAGQDVNRRPWKFLLTQAAEILFTADPVTSNRKVSSIDASFGLGEALVSGLVNAYVYQVRDGKVIAKKISTKKLAVFASHDGGTKEQEIRNSRDLVVQKMIFP